MAILEGGVAEAIVGCALLVVLQDVIGLVDFLELVFAIVIAGIAIGMQRLGKLAIGTLDNLRRRTLFDAQYIVIATLIHTPLTAINDGPLPPIRKKASRSSSFHSGIGVTAPRPRPLRQRQRYAAPFFLFSSTSVNSASTTFSSFGAAPSLPGWAPSAPWPCCALYIASPSFMEACASD